MILKASVRPRLVALHISLKPSDRTLLEVGK